jgi:crotonobetainyl-CoA:carnitine CoA-transferase CaiB-like acyl-CoA transferase
VCELIGDERLSDKRYATRSGRLAHRDELRPLLEAWTQQRDKLDIYHTAQSFGIPVGMVADVEDLLASPQYTARRFFETIDHPSTGPVAYPGVPCTIDGVRPTSSRAPLLGEHNEPIYRDRLGLTSAELVRLRECQVI